MKRDLQATEFGGVTALRLSTARSRAVRLHAYCFLWDNALVDSAFPRVRDALLCYLRRSPPACVLLTHAHEDHCGNARAVQDAFGAVPVAPPDLADRLAHPERETYGAYRRVIWGAPAAAVNAQPPPENVWDAGRRRFRFVPAPGHLPQHYAVFEERTRFVFTGDLFINRRPRYAKGDEVMAQTIRSLRAVASLNPRVMFDAHAGPVPDPTARLLAKADYLEDLQQRALRLAGQGLSPRAIARRLLGREGLMSYLTAGDYTKINMIRSLLLPAGSASGGA